MRVLVLILTLCASSAAIGQTRVIDGDTIDLDGTIIRLNGIDAPEHGQICGDWQCGREATDALARLISGKAVSCQKITTDGYGRDISTCFAGGRDVGEALVESGHAWAFLKYADTYEVTQAKAKSLGLGVWSGDFQTPWDYRTERWNDTAQAAPDGCPIKGNISRSGRIYHAPWSPWYERTRINERKGERWFCNEAEALAAGWRAPYWD